MKKLFKLLKSNNKAIKALDVRLHNTETTIHYSFGREAQRTQELNRILKIKKRVLRMRFRILENIQSKTLKEMQNASVQSRELNLLAA